MQNYAEILFIDEVRALQERDGIAHIFEANYPKRTKAALDENDQAFITSRESFYIASVSSNGWPYVQHRGGPPGFIKIIDDNRIGFLDYPGNRQFITMGHAAKDNKVSLFFMDYERQARLKMLGYLSMEQIDDSNQELCMQLQTPGQPRAERVSIIEVVAIDWNCPKYIPQMLDKEKIMAYVDSQVRLLAEENEALKTELANLKNSQANTSGSI